MSTRAAIAGALHDAQTQKIATTAQPSMWELPQEQADKVAKEVTRRVRMFWMQSPEVPKNAITETLVARAIHAEVRAFEAEANLAEMALICKGAEQKIEELETQLTNTAKGIKGA